MGDLYQSYAELEAAETEGVDYLRTSRTTTGATWASIAIHGGGIEAGSGEMADAVAGARMDFYEFDGIKTSGNSDLHITSTLFDEPICVDLVAASIRTLSFHGYAGTTGVAETSIGGLDTDLRDRVDAALTAAGFTVVAAAQEIAGTDPANICNENASGAGVQLELSRALRESFFPNGDLSKSSRDSTERTQAFEDYAAAIRSVYTGRGLMAQGSINVSRWAVAPLGAEDVDVNVTVATDKLATGGPHFLQLAGRLTDTDNCYLARVAFNTDQTVTLTLRKRVAGSESFLAQYDSDLTHGSNTQFSIRLSVDGSTLRAKVWLTGEPEPSGWYLTETDTSLTGPGDVGLRAILSSVNTNVLPVVASWTAVNMATPQGFTVNQAPVNGIAKTVPAGSDVRLAHPLILSL